MVQLNKIILVNEKEQKTFKKREIKLNKHDEVINKSEEKIAQLVNKLNKVKTNFNRRIIPQVFYPNKSYERSTHIFLSIFHFV